MYAVELTNVSKTFKGLRKQDFIAVDRLISRRGAKTDEGQAS